MVLVISSIVRLSIRKVKNKRSVGENPKCSKEDSIITSESMSIFIERALSTAYHAVSSPW